MVSIQTIAGFTIKLLKLVLNGIILKLYRTGYQGDFLGIGGTWNLNENKNPDAEIIGSGIFFGYFLYTSVTIIGRLFGSKEYKREPVDIMMNFIGLILWVAVGATALHYWHGYQGEHKYIHVDSERQKGLAMGALCVLSGAVYLLDTVVALVHYVEENY